MDKQEAYLALLSKTYDEAIEYLLAKYGQAEDDYYREKSYERFFKGEIKNITRGKYSRSSEGLECHHIDENKFLNMTNSEFIKSQKIPFKYHKKEKLVFCDVIEHAILHTLIAKETSLEFGVPGYTVFLRPKIVDWYITKDIPQKSKHHIACYHKAYIETEEASKILKEMDTIISTEEERIWQEERKRIKEIIKKGNFKNLNSGSPRHEVVRAMYELNKIGASGYLHIFNEFIFSEKLDKRIIQPVEFEEFENRMELFDFDGILANTQSYIKYVEGKINRKEYLSQRELFSKTKKEIIAEQRVQEEKERSEKLKKRKQEKFDITYPKFRKIGLRYDVNRQELNALLFKYCDKYPSFIRFQSVMKEYDMNELLEKLHSNLKE